MMSQSTHRNHGTQVRAKNQSKKYMGTYGESSAHKVHQVRVLDLDDGHGDWGLVLLGLGDLGFLLRHDCRGIESLEQQIPTK